MQRVFASHSVFSRLSPRWLYGGGALFLFAGLSYATGLTRTIRGWFIEVEGFELTADPDVSQDQTNPNLDYAMQISMSRDGVRLESDGDDPTSLVLTPQEPIIVEGFEWLGTDEEALQVPIRRSE